jgi:SAM-dependent methyltransferase
MADSAYDQIGIGYSDVRRPDPRIAARIQRALGPARTILNVGAGAGSYEPVDREVTAVEPSEVMIAQRPAGAAPAIQARAEALPFEDESFDAAMAIITVHHWEDPATGLAEMVRVAHERVVVLTFDPTPLAETWMARDYFPRLQDMHTELMPPIDRLLEMLPNARIESVPAPRLCRDQFWCALWDRPEMLLDPEVRRGSSGWHLISPEEMRPSLEALRADLASGRWDERYGSLRNAPELDVGLRLLVAELT